MRDNGEKILEELTLIVEKYLANLDSDASLDETLLTIHRVILVLLEIHERTMYECGLTEDQLIFNRDILKQAKELIEYELELGITMPGGDA